MSNSEFDRIAQTRSGYFEPNAPQIFYGPYGIDDGGSDVLTVSSDISDDSN
ncbi:1930_t:CDS:2 [Gigaspora rosea]|nr:1930_t:CDS:2 [Gigaspora rosea]